MTKSETDLYEMERLLRRQGYRTICGVDEVGRGPLAGPVYACAAILPEGYTLPGVNDSKKLSPKRREALCAQLKEEITYSIGEASPQEIDQLNILNATFLAMERAIAGLPVKPDAILVDGNKLPPHLPEVYRTSVVGGDAKVAVIAAASILAKVARDRMMSELGEQYAVYEFSKHIGYGTKLHYEKLFQFGPSDIHRRSFLKNLEEKRAAYEKEREQS